MKGGKTLTQGHFSPVLVGINGEVHDVHPLPSFFIDGLDHPYICNKEELLSGGVCCAPSACFLGMMDDVSSGSIDTERCGMH
eukprot:2765629-Ditylum_brightwellii.AAC.1